MRIGLLSDFVEPSSSIIGRDSRLTLPRAPCRAMTAYRRGFEEVQRRVLGQDRPVERRAELPVCGHSMTGQSRHYGARPCRAPVTGPVTGPARGAQLGYNPTQPPLAKGRELVQVGQSDLALDQVK